MKFMNDMPMTSVRDIAIQKRENDIVVGTFGRGFYVMDDYSPLQKMKKEDFDQKAKIFPIKDGIVYNASFPLGHKGKSFQGASFFQTDNPSVGATFTYYIKDEYRTLKQIRRDVEKEKMKNNQPVYYPSVDSMRLEDREEAAFLLFVITDEAGNAVRQLKAPAKKGLQRIVWDGRHELTAPVNFNTPDYDNPYEWIEQGALAIPGIYKVHIIKMQNGTAEKMTEPLAFAIKTLNNTTFSIKDKREADAFNKNLAEFRRVVQSCDSYRGEMKNKLKYIKQAALMKGGEALTIMKDVKATELELIELEEKFNGDKSLAKREFETLPGLNGILDGIVYSIWSTWQPSTTTWKEQYDKANNMFRPMYNTLKKVKGDIEGYEKKLEMWKAPYTPGRELPEWNIK